MPSGAPLQEPGFSPGKGPTRFSVLWALVVGLVVGLLIGLVLGPLLLPRASTPPASSIAPNRGALLLEENLTSWQGNASAAIWSTTNFTASASGYASENVSVEVIIHGGGFTGNSYFARLQAPTVGLPWGSTTGSPPPFVYGTVWVSQSGLVLGYGSAVIPVGSTELTVCIADVGQVAAAPPVTVIVDGY